MEVDDPTDERLRPYTSLNDPALRRLSEGRDGVFVVEGRWALEVVLAAGARVMSVMVLHRRLAELAPLGVGGGLAGVPVYAVGPAVMDAVAGFNVHRGLLAVAERPLARPVAELLEGPAQGTVVVVEGVNDQENLGAIFRNAAAFGAAAVLLDPTCADPFYRRTVRVSMGQVARVPSARLQPWPRALSVLEEHGLELVALTPDRAAPELADVSGELTGRRVAMLVGAEGRGLSGPVLRRCRPARIPMADGVDSLNVAAATAVGLYGLARRP